MNGTEAAQRGFSVLIEIVATEHDQVLRDVAERFFERNPAALPPRYNGPLDPSEIELDHAFGAVPVGPGSGFQDIRDRRRPPRFTRQTIAGWFKPDTSQKFVVCGFVKKASALERFATDKSETAPVFHSDAPIGPRLVYPPPTCGTTPYVGTVDDVHAKIDTQTLADLGLDGTNVALAIVDTGIFLPRITQLLGDFSPSGFQPNIDIANS